MDSDNLTIKSLVSDKDVLIQGNDGGSGITALTLDMSAAGAAAFNDNVTVGGKLIMPDVTSAKILVSDGTSYEEVAVSGDVSIASGGAVTIANDAVEQAMIGDDAVGADQLAASAVVTASIVDDNVTQAKIADDAVGADQLAASAVVTASIVDDNVTQAKMADDAIGADQLAASAVVTASIVDDNVTQAKIADDAVGADQLAADAVVNASVASGAAIADSKLATISTANKVDVGALDIDGATDIGAGLADADLIIVDDNASGTERKSAMSRVKTYVADVTLTTAAQTNITSLGTLTALTVDDVAVDGKVVTMTGSASDTAVLTAGTNGTLSIVTTDAAAAAANITITADGTFEADGTTVTLDSAGDIVLDAAGDEVIFKDGSTNVGHVSMDSDNLTIKSLVSDKDMIFQGNDGGSPISALTFDMSAAGAATFNAGIVVPDAGTIGSASSTSAITIAATGIVTLVDDLVLKDAATIGVASSTSAITIASTGIVTFVDDIIIKDAGTIGSASDVDAIAIGADGDVTLTQDLELQHDGAILSFGGNDEIALTHVHDTGLLLTDSGGSPTLQLHDAGESVSSDGSKLILTSNSVAFSMPTADGDDGQVLTTDGSGTIAWETASGGDSLRRNSKAIIINGDMQVAQRSTSEAALGDGDEGYVTVDRVRHTIGATSAGRFTSARTAITDLAGFSNCLHLDCTTADTSIATGELFTLDWRIEGQNLQMIEKGFSSAKAITISFYMKAQDAKVYVIELSDIDNTRHIAKTFTSATSWTQHILSFAADTTGKFDNDNAESLRVRMWLHAGATYTGGTLASSWASTNNANSAAGIGSFFDATDNDIKITGMRLEVGSYTSDTIPSFQHESYGENFERCQRYFQKYTQPPLIGSANANNTLARARMGLFPTQFRAAPTATQSGTMSWFYSNSHQPTSTGFSATYLDVDCFEADITVSGTGMTATHPCGVFQSGSAFVQFDAEI